MEYIRSNNINVLLHNKKETAAFAARVAKVISPLIEYSVYIALYGSIGIGKTTFTQYLLRNLGVKEKIKSPTYSLCELYLGKYKDQIFNIHHFDFYRMKYTDEWIDSGLEDIFYEKGICIVEWPQKIDYTNNSSEKIFIYFSMQCNNIRSITVKSSNQLQKKIMQNLLK